MNDINKVKFLQTTTGNQLAYQYFPGKGPTVVFLGGYASDMSGSKAEWLSSHCADNGRAYLRFDYSGHGQSTGEFDRGTIGQWMEDALFVIDYCTTGKLILIGSSMGGWIMLLIATVLKDRLFGLIGIAAAPDFSEDLMWSQFHDETRKKLINEGIIYLPSDYTEQGMPLRREFIEDGRLHLVLRDPIKLHCPIRLLHGLLDSDVPADTADKILHAVESDDVHVCYVKNADHRFSSNENLLLLSDTLERLVSDEKMKGHE